MQVLLNDYPSEETPLWCMIHTIVVFKSMILHLYSGARMPDFLYEYYTYGAGLLAGGAVLTTYYGHPVAAAISTAGAMITAINAFREVAENITSRIEKEAEICAARIAQKIESECTDVINDQQHGTDAILARLWPAHPDYKPPSPAATTNQIEPERPKAPTESSPTTLMPAR